MKKITLIVFMFLMSWCGYAQLPLETFDNNGTSLPPGWQQLNVAGPGQFWRVVAHNAIQSPAYGDTGFVAFLNRENVLTDTTEDWLVTPQFNAPANGQLRFMSRLTQMGDDGSTYRIMIHVGNDPTNTAAYTQVQSWTELTLNPDPFQTQYLEKVVQLPASSANQMVYVAFVMNGDFGDRWLVDNVKVVQQCLNPVGQATTNIGTNTATLNWTNPSGASQWNIDIVSATGAPTGVGFPYTGPPNNSYVATTDSAGNPLQPATQYKYYLKATCPDTGTSDWVGPYFFTTVVPGTNCTAPIVITTNTYSHTSNTNLYGDDIEGTPGATGCNAGNNFLNGDEVVYAYTPTYTGNAGFSMTNNGANSGMFIYTSCANIGVSCAAGGTGNATTPVNISSFPVTAGTTYYVVISTSGTTQSTPYTLTIQQVNCAPPVGQPTTGVGPNSANLSWTNPSGATGWQVVTQPAGTGIPAGAGTPANTNSNWSATGLLEATNYEYYVRADCGDGTWSAWAGPYTFSTTQTPAPLNYVQNFDGATHGWALNNGTQPNKWVVGTSTFNSAGKSLYISDDNSAYNYNINSQSTVQAYRDLQIPASVGQVNVSFDWKGVGESCCDFLRVWVVPATWTPTPGTQITAANSGGVQLGANMNAQANWQTVNFVVNAAPFANSVRRLVFEWRNDGSVGPNPPAAIDNINISMITCSSPTALTLGTVTENSATFNWTAPGGATPTYDYYFGTSATAPVAGTAPTGNVAATTVTMNSLTPSTTYYFWVRSNCGTTDGNSFWVGPVSFTTPQVPATMDFTDNFDGATSEWILSNGTQTNKWVIGTATFNSPGKSLYISNDNGVTHAFNNGSATTVHAYRDIQMPATLDQMTLSFNWKALAETCCDFVRVWVVPATFTPTPGTQITAANSGGIQIGGNHNAQADWQSANYTINGAAFGGSIRRLIFEWRNDGSIGNNPPGAIDNVNLQVLTCPAPTALTITSLTENAATIGWTAPTSVTPTYDYVFGTSNTAPVAGTTPTGNTANTSNPFTGLTPSTTYYFWVRSNCGTSNSVWVGPLSFTTPQIPSPMPLVEDFDDATSPWTLVNGTQTNKWFIGGATFDSPSQSLYITNDNGVSHAFNNGSATTVHAYRDVQMPATLDQLTLSFRWKALAENCCDFVRVWLVPVTFTPVAGTQITAASGGIQIGGNHNGQANWQTANYTVNGAGMGGSIRRLVFEWRNDLSIGDNPPGAIDDVNFQVLTCPAPTNLVLSNLTTTSATVAWTAPTSVTPTYDYFLSTSSVPPAAGATPTGNVSTTSVNLSGLLPSTTYYFWVRSNCGSGDTSVLVGPLVINTPQIPADLNYSENFDGATSPWTILNGTQTNQWAIGTATFNSPGKSLYITNDSGVSNAFTITAASTVMAYRDLAIPATAGEIEVAFDWKGVGENCCDFLRVWLVPITYTPTPGTQTTAANSGGIQLGANMNMQDNWQNASFTVPVTGFAGTTRRIIFEWRNDGSVGTQPPAAVDNVNISVILCPKPTNLQVSNVTATQATYTWTPVGPATAWEVYVAPAGSPSPTETTTGMPATTPTLTQTTGLIPGVEYVVYVRSVCGGANGVSTWTGPVPFVMEPLCPEPDNLTVDCISDVGASFDWDAGGSETEWEYALLPATAPFPTDGTVIGTSGFIADGLTVDTNYIFYVRAVCADVDGYSTWAQVAFETTDVSIVGAQPFCGDDSNGAIIYNNTTGVPSPGQIACLGGAPNGTWFYLQVEDAGQLDMQIIQNTNIDADGNLLGTGLDVDYAAWGPFTNLTEACDQIELVDCPTCPNNTTDPDFYPFGNIVDCSFSIAPVESLTIPNAQPGQIYAVLITNWNGSAGQIMFQQLDSSTGSTNCNILYDVALSPDQILCGVNQTTITATVTTPEISALPTYQWFMDGSTTPFTPTVVSTTDLTQTILITEPGYHTYTVVVDVENAANTTPITDTMIVALGPEVNVPTPAEVVLCGPNGQASIDLTTLNDDVLGALLPADFEVSYYLTETAAENATGFIDTTVPFVTGSTVIYVRVNSIAVDTCYDVVALTITVNETASATISYADAPFCTSEGAAAVTHTGDTGGVYSSATGLTIDPVTGEITPGTSTPGTYTVSYTLAATPACPEFVATFEVIIEEAPAATIAYDGTPYCAGAGVAPVTFTGTTGGVYSSTPGLIIDPATGEIDLAASTAGTYTVTYTIAAGVACDALTVTTEVVLNTQFTATIDYGTAPYCSDAGTATVTHTGNTGGVYSSSEGLVIDPATGTIDLASSTAGTYTVTYMLEATASCPEFTTTATVVIEAAPAAAIAYAATPYCANAGTAAVTLTGTAGGVYSGTAGLVIDPATGDIDLAASTLGTHTVTYTIAATAACGSLAVTAEVVISPLPVAAISYVGSPYCSDAGTATVTFAGDAGGVYAGGAGLVINAATGDIDLAASTAGTYNVTYTIAAANGCPEVVATASVTITKLPSATFTYEVAAVCQNAGGTEAPTFDTGAVAGTFTVDVPGLAIDAATGVINPATSTEGTYIVTNTIAAANGCGVVSHSVTIIINPAPIADFSYSALAYCQDSSNPSPALEGGAGTFSSTAGLVINPATGVIDLAASTPGTYTVTNTIPGTPDCPAVSASVQVTITSIPVVAVLQGCEGGAYILEVTFDADEIYTVDNVDFVWTNGAGVTVGTDSKLQVTEPGTYHVTVIPQANGDCSMDVDVPVADTTCDVPRGVSPNADGKNDTFDLTALDVRKLSIFNRYGQEVYSRSNGYTDQWHGQAASGDELPTGTYFYMIERSNGITKTGWVYVNREE